MSMVFSLTAIGVAMGITAVCGAASVVEAFSQHKCGEREIEPIETKFEDLILLQQALEAHGFMVEEEGTNLLVKTNVGSLRFYFNDATESIWVQAFDLVDENELATSLGEVGDTYLQAVQRSNYLRLIGQTQARNDVTVVSEEILEDDTIVVTIEV